MKTIVLQEDKVIIMVKRFYTLGILILLFIILPSVQITSQTQQTVKPTAPRDSFFDATTPIIYGEKQFLARIHKDSDGRTPIGLVLSGGSARAFAHIGVLQSLEDQGIIPDFIVSNSMGSIIGLLYSAGLSPAQIYEIVKTTDLGSLFSLTMPTNGGFLDVSKLSDYIHAYLGDLTLENLPIPIMIVCEDLKTKQEIWIASGDFYQILEASYAIPFYFQPVLYKGHHLIDGGITNLLHLDTAYAYSDSIIASTSFYDNPKLNLKNPITILNISIDISKRRAGVSDILTYDPILIKCPVESYSFMDFDNFEAIYQAGYDAANEMSEALSVLPRRPLQDDQLAQRREFNKTFTETKNDIDIYGFLPARKSYGDFNLSTEFYGAPFDTTPLNDDLLISMAYNRYSPTSESSLQLGVSIDIYKDFTYAPVVRVTNRWFPIPAIMTTVTGRVFLLPDFSAIDAATFNGSANGMIYMQGPYRIDLHSSGIAKVESNWLIDYSRLSLDITGRYLRSYSQRSPSIVLTAGYRLEDLAVHAIDTEFLSTIPLKNSPFIIGINTVGVIPIVSGEKVHFFKRDHFRSSLDEGPYYRVMGSSINLQYQPVSFSIPLSELLLLKDMKVGIYSDALWCDNLSWGAGLTFSSSIALIGIEPGYVQLYGGYDSLRSGFVWSLLFSFDPFQ